MDRRIVIVLVAAVVLLGWGRGPLAQEKAKPQAELLSFKDEDSRQVSQSEDIEGQLNAEGWPVVLVKPLAGNQPWWVQDPIQEVNKGKFSASVQFGDDKTKPGTKFRIVIVVTKSKEEALKFEAGKRDSLPPGLPRSSPVEVTRK